LPLAPSVAVEFANRQPPAFEVAQDARFDDE
jgi:hypothetical protein